MYELRVLTSEDWQAWRAMRLSALGEAPEAFSATLAEWSGEGDTELRWRGRLEQVALHVLAYDGDMPVGMISATEPKHGEAWLLSLWVDPVARGGTGVSDLLVQAVVGWARGLGAERVMLGVVDSNHAATRLYERNGFVDNGSPVVIVGAVERRMALSLR